MCRWLAAPGWCRVTRSLPVIGAVSAGSPSVPRRSAGNVWSGGLLADAVLRADGGLRCGRGGVASCACVCCGLVVFETEGATGLACSASFGCGLAADGGELAPASAAGVVAGAGIVVVGFFATGLCFDGVDCAAA